MHSVLLRASVRFCGIVVVASLSACGSSQAAALPPDEPTQVKPAAASDGQQPAPVNDGQQPYPGEPREEALPSDCAAQTSSNICFSTVEAACQSLGCPADRCSIGYSLPPMVSCAAPGEEAWVPE